MTAEALKRGMTAAAFQSLGISDDMKEWLNRLVIGVATISADHFVGVQILQLFQNITCRS
jgi:hypothetical protein